MFDAETYSDRRSRLRQALKDADRSSHILWNDGICTHVLHAACGGRSGDVRKGGTFHRERRSDLLCRKPLKENLRIYFS